MRLLVTYIILILLLIAVSVPASGDERVQFAKSLSAKTFDRNLPSVPVEKWLLTRLPKDVHAEWGKSITDCGEQTGDPAIDRRRDLPLCAEIELKKDSALVGYLLLSIGTERKGLSPEFAGLFSGYVLHGSRTVPLKSLGDVVRLQQGD